jgi:hypothetical protein
MSDRIPATTDKKPAPLADIINIHTLSVMVNNQPGVLGRSAPCSAVVALTSSHSWSPRRVIHASAA